MVRPASQAPLCPPTGSREGSGATGTGGCGSAGGQVSVGVFLEFHQKAPVCGFGLVFVKEGP